MVKSIPFTKKMMQVQARKSLRGLPIESVAGIGKVLGARLRALGLRTALALKTRTKRMDPEKFVNFMKISIKANCRQSVMCFETLRGRLSQRSIEKACRSRVLGGRLRESCNAIVTSDEIQSRRDSKVKKRKPKGKKHKSPGSKADYELDEAYISEGHASLNTNCKSTQFHLTCTNEIGNKEDEVITCNREVRKQNESVAGDWESSNLVVSTKPCRKKSSNVKQICGDSDKKSSQMASCYKQCNNLSSKHIDINKIKYINKMLSEICKEHSSKSKPKCYNPYNPRDEPLNKDSYVIRDLEIRKPASKKRSSSRKVKTNNTSHRMEVLDKNIKMPKSPLVLTKSQKEFDEWFSKYERPKTPALTRSKSLMEFTDRADGKMSSNRNSKKITIRRPKPMSKISSSYYLLVV